MNRIDRDFIKTFVVGWVETNMYLIVTRRANPTSEGARAEGIVIDPGFTETEAGSIIKRLKSEVDGIPIIFLTHCHFDHISGCHILKREFDSKIYCHRLEEEKLRDPQKSGALLFGLAGISLKADRYIDDGEELRLFDLRFKIIYTPGHTKGGISILMEDRFLFSGDTIFQGSIGRTDLGDGSYEEELDSITRKILTLADNTIIYPGHGPKTTVAREKKNFQ